MKDVLTYFYCLCLLLAFGCKQSSKAIEPQITELSTPKDSFVLHTKHSPNQYFHQGFNSAKAINRIAEIENEYFNNVEDSMSRYYGTQWKKFAQTAYEHSDSCNVYLQYLSKMKNQGKTTDSMHCTIYAMEALKAGMENNFQEIDSLHKSIWKNREYAGWSIGHLLVKEFDWKAYLVIGKSSSEYDTCIKNFKKDKKYHVWKQPNIPLEQLLDFKDDEVYIDSLLNEYEFAWGFSEQGWHTWITRFDELKECNWSGAPSKDHASYGGTLFLSTPFSEYYDYASHILVFPPKKENKDV